ncbi:hypothetical protein ACFQMM_04765 [Saliphagus sp. GCM10025308]
MRIRFSTLELVGIVRLTAAEFRVERPPDGFVVGSRISSVDRRARSPAV